MSCLNLNKLLPGRRAWRVFTNKVQTKLNKLHPSKTTKKPKNRHRKSCKKSSCWPVFSVRRKRFKLKPTQSHSYHSYYYQKRPAAVYVDQLFIEPAVKEFLQPPIRAAAENKELKEETCQSTSSAKTMTSSMHSADDMWESLVLASPQMNGINERAEEFITKFRAEMMLQERLARQL